MEDELLDVQVHLGHAQPRISDSLIGFSNLAYSPREARRRSAIVTTPPFAAARNDADLADTLTFVRKAFGKGASAVTASDIARQR